MGHTAEKTPTFFYSNYGFVACESHRNQLSGGLSRNPKKSPALVTRGANAPCSVKSGRTCRALSASKDRVGAKIWIAELMTDIWGVGGAGLGCF